MNINEAVEILGRKLKNIKCLSYIDLDDYFYINITGKDVEPDPIWGYSFDIFGYKINKMTKEVSEFAPNVDLLNLSEFDKRYYAAESHEL